LQIGLVGLPGSGKTTLFNALVRADAETGGYIGSKKSNRGAIRVPDERLSRLSQLFNPRKTTFATVEYLEIGGFEPGRVKQEDQEQSEHLNALRNMDLIVHVLRGYKDLSEKPIPPTEDFELVALELAVRDLELIERRLTRLSKEARSTKRPDLIREWELLEHCREEIEGGGVIRNLEFAPEELKILRGYQFLSQKPVLLLLNLSEQDLGNESQMCAAKTDWSEGHPAIALCAAVEMEIAQLDEKTGGLLGRKWGSKNPL